MRRPQTASLRCVTRGRPGAPLILWLHGFMGGAEDWLPVMEGLGDGWRHLAPDLPGHGDDAPPAPGFDRLADALAALAAEAALPPWTIAGYSMGGRIALYTALRHPDRFSRVILESATPGLEDADARAARAASDEALAQELERGDFAAFLARWYAQPLFATLRRSPGAIEGLIADRLARRDPVRLADALRRLGVGRQPSLWDVLGRARAAALLVTGREDAKFEAIARQMATRWGAPEAVRRVSVPRAGHNVHLEARADYIDAVRAFLER